jgi:alpha-tubulin suppressor-like RCC1 family protein
MPIKRVKHAIDIACGRHHSLVVDDTSQLFAFGSHSEGQLGIKYKIPVLHEDYGQENPRRVKPFNNIVRVYCCENSSYIVDSSKRVFVFGNNQCGLLGLGAKKAKNIKYPTLNPELEGMDLYPGYNHVFAVNARGEVFGFGNNVNSQLGFGKSCQIFLSIHAAC